MQERMPYEKEKNNNYVFSGPYSFHLCRKIESNSYGGV